VIALRNQGATVHAYANYIAGADVSAADGRTFTAFNPTTGGVWGTFALAGPAEVELPWRRPMGERFWRRYFEGTHTGKVTGAQAWKRLTPFRGTLPCGISAAVPDVKMSFESYFAPHGIALLATADYEGAQKSLPEVADIAHAVRFGPFFGRVGGAANRRLEPVDFLLDSHRALVRLRVDFLADPCHARSKAPRTVASSAASSRTFVQP
jgi:hypothetical protein